MNMGELCPRFEKAMQLLSTRWVGLILSELLKGKKRFSEMESDLPISGRLLSDRLKMLEKEQIVERKVFSEFPVRIEYSLTEKGKALAPVIQEIGNWAEDWVTLEREADESQQHP
ncbi:MAG TPA: helix-turn-helix domain-containing protein [Bacillota bacterium]|nr:helix-turn-helix domain-containing protein [Bacillota bacterium]